MRGPRDTHCRACSLNAPLRSQVKVAFWNPTVANLTLLALGSSAPEILLAVIGTVGTLGGEPDELGASTIVGSAVKKNINTKPNPIRCTASCLLACSGAGADFVGRRSQAFNLLAITAVCIVSCPSGEVRKVTQVYVFICTSAWSIFAYGWLIVILELWTPDEVTLVEAIITAGSMGVRLHPLPYLPPAACIAVKQTFQRDGASSDL